MADPDRKSGPALGRMRGRLAEALARRRVPLGFLFAALVLWRAQPTLATLQWGIALGVAGEAVRIWAAGHLNKAREVTTSGPYRFVAHPLYVGSSIMGAGLAIASGSVAASAMIAVYLAATLMAAITREEALLRAKFGGAYDAYRRAGRVDQRRSFSASLAIANREYRAVAGFIAAVLLLVLKATYNGTFRAVLNR